MTILKVEREGREGPQVLEQEQQPPLKQVLSHLAEANEAIGEPLCFICVREKETDDLYALTAMKGGRDRTGEIDGYFDDKPRVDYIAVALTGSHAGQATTNVVGRLFHKITGGTPIEELERQFEIVDLGGTLVDLITQRQTPTVA